MGKPPQQSVARRLSTTCKAGRVAGNSGGFGGVVRMLLRERLMHTTPRTGKRAADLPRARVWLRRLSRVSIQVAARLLDRLPGADRDGMQLFRPDPVALRSEGSPEDSEQLWTNTRRGFQSLDGRLASGEWESGRGQHDIKFDFDEWVYILEGAADVTAQGTTTTLRAGDAAMFRAGLSMSWNVPRYVRKVWVHRYSQPNPVERGVLQALDWIIPAPSARGSTSDPLRDRVASGSAAARTIPLTR